MPPPRSASQISRGAWSVHEALPTPPRTVQHANSSPYGLRSARGAGRSGRAVLHREPGVKVRKVGHSPMGSRDGWAGTGLRRQGTDDRLRTGCAPSSGTARWSPVFVAAFACRSGRTVAFGVAFEQPVRGDRRGPVRSATTCPSREFRIGALLVTGALPATLAEPFRSIQQCWLHGASLIGAPLPALERRLTTRRSSEHERPPPTRGAGPPPRCWPTLMP